MSYFPQGTSGAATGNVSQSTIVPTSGTGVIAIPLVNILTASFKPQSYGAKFDGSTDDTTAWTNLFKDVVTKGFGEIEMPPGATIIRPGVLNIPSNVVIRGRGQYSSSFQRYSGQTGLLLRMNGSGSSAMATGTAGSGSHCVNSVLADLGIQGGGIAGALLQTVYSSNHLFSNVLFSGSQDAGLQAVEFWDSGFNNCLWDSCGMNSSATAYTTNTRLGSEAIQLLGGLAASGTFGASIDSNNQIAFSRCRIETFGAGAIAIQKYLGTGTGNYAIRMTDFKIESGVLSGINFISMSDSTQAVCLERSYLSLNASTGTNASTVDMIYLGASFGNQIRNVVVNLGVGVQSVVRHFGNPGSKVEDLFINGNGCSQAALYIPGGSQVPYRNILYVNNQTSAVVGPTSYAPYS